MQQEVAELLRRSHIKGARLKVEIGHQHTHPGGGMLPLFFQLCQTGNDAAGLNPVIQRLLDGDAESGEVGRVGGHQIAVQLAEIGEKLRNDRLNTAFFGALDLHQNILDQQVVIGGCQPVPKILHADIAQLDMPFVAASSPFGLHVFQQELFEQKGDDGKQRF